MNKNPLIGIINKLALVLSIILILITILTVIFMNGLFEQKWLRILIGFIGLPMAVTSIAINSLKDSALYSDETKEKNKIPWLWFLSLLYTVITTLISFADDFKLTRSLSLSSVYSGTILLSSSLSAGILAAIISFFKKDEETGKVIFTARIILTGLFMFLFYQVYSPMFLYLIFKITGNNSYLASIIKTVYGESILGHAGNIFYWHFSFITAFYMQFEFFRKWWSKNNQLSA